MSERKTSKSGAKQFDKRWQPIPARSFVFSYQLDRVFDLYLCASTESRKDKLELLGVILAIADGLDCAISLGASERLEWLSEDFLTAGKVLRQTIKALQVLNYAKRCVECEVGNQQRSAQAAA